MEANLMIDPKKMRHSLIIEGDRIILKEKEVEIVNESVEGFMAQFDKLIFKGKNGKQAIFIKQ